MSAKPPVPLSESSACTKEEQLGAYWGPGRAPQTVTVPVEVRHVYYMYGVLPPERALQALALIHHLVIGVLLNVSCSRRVGCCSPAVRGWRLLALSARPAQRCPGAKASI